MAGKLSNTGGVFAGRPEDGKSNETCSREEKGTAEKRLNGTRAKEGKKLLNPSSSNSSS